MWPFNTRDNCYKGGKKHNFNPRYSTYTTPVANLQISEYMMALDPELVKSLSGNTVSTTHTYNGDVCTWCGKIVNNKHRY